MASRVPKVSEVPSAAAPESSYTVVRDQAVRDLDLSHRRLLEAVKERMLLLDIDTGRVNDVNSALIKRLGFFPREMFGETVGELGPIRRFGDETKSREKLEEEITQIQRRAGGVRRAAWLMAALTALAVAGFGYPAILLENIPDRAQQLIVTLFCALGVGSMISLLAFAGLGMVYRKRLCQRRLKYYQLVAKLLEARLATPV